MKKTSKQDTGFVPRQIQIWKCAKPSEPVRSAVKSQQQVLNTVCKMYCVCKMQCVGCPNGPYSPKGKMAAAYPPVV